MELGKISRQFELEKESRAEGIRRSDSRNTKLRKSEMNSMTRSVKNLVGYYIDTIARELKADLTAWVQGRGRSNFEAYNLINSLEPDVLTVITLKTVMNFCATEDSATSLFKRVGEAINTEIRIRSFEEARPELFKVLDDDLKKRAWGYRYKRRKLMESSKKAGIVWDTWTVKQRILVGVRLVNYVLAHTDLIELLQLPKSQKRVKYTDQCVAWITKSDYLQAINEPYWYPMIVKPRPWRGTYPSQDPAENMAGGYLSMHLRQLSLVRVHNRDYLEELNAFPMQEVYTAVNAIQETRWTVDNDMLEFVGELWDTQSPLGKIPCEKLIDIPPKPPGEYEVETWKAWKHEAVKAYVAKEKLNSRRILAARTLQVAEKFKDEEEIYYVHTLDFRGRAYPQASYLQPQGDGMCRSLLRFADAEGKPMNDDAARELAIYGASLLGYDKVSLDDRVAWISEHEEEILRSADDPYECRFWDREKKPLLNLAWCKEWKGWKEHGKDFYSTLPVMRDGTCNAIQHWAAILKDQEAACHVNMTGNVIPGDAYLVSLARLTDNLKKKAALGDEIAKGWLEFGIDRDLTKKPTMTLAYGSRKYRLTDTVCDWVADRCETENIPEPFDGHYFHPARALTDEIWDAIRQTVGSVMVGMKFLQQCAGVLHKAGLPVTWITPTGMYVRQVYPELKDRRIKTKLLGNTIRMTVKEAVSDKFSRHKQVNAVAANFIHSLDASALMSTVVEAKNRGVNAFCMIHDSYGTVAADSPTLSQVTREKFCEMYTDTNHLKIMRDHIKEALHPEFREMLPEIPEMGTYEIDQVLRSDHFFS